MARKLKAMTMAADQVTTSAVESESRDSLSDPVASGDTTGGFVFESANAVKEHPLHPALVQIMEKVYLEDLVYAYDELEAGMKECDELTERGATKKALGMAETNYRKAHKLYLTARFEHKKWNLENLIVFGAMRRDATEALQQEKKQGERSKAITEADVHAKCAELFQDEYVAQEMKRENVQAIEDDIENLAKSWEMRCQTLRVLCNKQQ